MSGMMLMVAGGGGVDVNLTTRTITDTATSTTAGVTMFLNNDGSFTYQRNVGSNGTIAGEWTASPIASAVAALYEVVVTLTSGTYSAGSGAGTFNLGSSRSWTVSAATGLNKTTTATFAIRRVSDAVTLATASITLTANAA